MVHGWLWDFFFFFQNFWLKLPFECFKSWPGGSHSSSKVPRHSSTQNCSQVSFSIKPHNNQVIKKADIPKVYSSVLSFLSLPSGQDCASRLYAIKALNTLNISKTQSHPSSDHGGEVVWMQRVRWVIMVDDVCLCVYIAKQIVQHLCC